MIVGLTASVLSGLIAAGINWTLVCVGIVLLFGAMAAVKAMRSDDSDTDEDSTRPSNHRLAQPAPRDINVVAPEELRHEYDKAFSMGDYQHAARIAQKMRDTSRFATACEAMGDLERAVSAWVEINEYIRAAHLFEQHDAPAKAAKLYQEGGRTQKAVECYLAAGKLEKAAQLLRLSGDEVRANELEAQAHTERGEHVEAARKYVASNQMLKAGEALLLAGEVKKAVEAFRRAGQAAEAASLLVDRAEWKSAAQLYEEAEYWEEASQCYDRLADWRNRARCLQAAGMAYSAGRVAWQNDDLELALVCFESIEPIDDHYQDAGLFRGQAYERQGRLLEAANAYALFLLKRTPDEHNKVLFFRVAQLQEGIGQCRQALGFLSRLVTAGFGTPDIMLWAERLEQSSNTVDDTEALLPESEVSAGPDVVAEVEPNILIKDRLTTPLKEMGSDRTLKFDDSIAVSAVDALDRRYKFVSRVGQGGNGIVYLAKDRALERDVVVKFLHQALLPSDVARKYFLREAKTVAGLRHPNIVTIYDLGEEGQTLYFSMECVDGWTLADIIVDAGGRLAHDRLVPWVTQLCSALDYAHNRQIIHRDIKPGNIMVSRQGSVKLLDFGLAKALDENPDKSVFLCGTPYYMSPEQIRREFLDHRTDVYSLGCLLYVMYTGDVPYPDGNIFHHHQSTTAPNPRDRVSNLPHGVADVLLKCVAKSREERYQSAGDVAKALSECPG